MQRRNQMLVALALAAGPAFADDQVRKCVGPDGAVIYTNQECPAATRLQPAQGRAEARTPPASAVPRDMKALAEQINADVDRALKRKQEELAKAPPPEQATPVRSDAEPMEFGVCRETMRQTMLAVAGKAPTRMIVNTAEVAMVKICTTDGSLILTCSAPDRKRITTRSPYRC